MPQAKTKKTVRDNVLFRKVIALPHRGEEDARTVRVAAYAPRPDQPHNAVTLGLGYKDPDKFSKIFIELTEENWKEINAAVRAAFKEAKAQ